MCIIYCVLYLKYPLSSAHELYILCIPLGIAIGYWAVFVTSASEQFGTNLRSTVTTTTPNFARGMITPLSIYFTFLKSNMGFDVVSSALIMISTASCLALYGTSKLKESFSNDLDFVEL